MDPFTQRMLERARARQEKIDQKLASTGQTVPKRKPLTENSLGIVNTETSLTKSPTRTLKNVSNSISPLKSPSRTDSQKFKAVNIDSPKKSRDVVVTKREFKSPRSSGSRRDSDVSVEINIMHRNDIQIEVQVEEREAPMTVIYDTHSNSASNVVIQEIEDTLETKMLEDKQSNTENVEPKSALSQNIKSRLDRLGVLYSDKPNLSSPIHRTENDFNSLSPSVACEIQPKQPKVELKGTKKKFGRLAALADQINNWEDDLTQHNHVCIYNSH
ncbi:Anillin [Eumeta japonica]|uniref:Anillin n=1 Tax=Eumeta variegata TaxID=151549 RepID=A0A4C1WWA1_EUMVA|nr:Anillin [Eumeta japonica]